MNRNRKLIASLVGIVALTNTVMPVCAKPSDTLVHANVTSINEGKKEKEQGNINLLDPSVGLVSNSNNMNNNGFPYQIQPHDTLSSIAMKNNTTVEKLMATAGITDPNKIKAGDILVSPHITKEFVLSKGQDPEQNKKRYKGIGVIKRTLTESERNILSSLFNAEEYAKMYPDVAEACKPFDDGIFTFEQKLFNHFIYAGIWEGRQPSKSFSVAAYASAYSDLRKSFGSHIVEYYKHYYNTTVIGNENRTITTVQKAQDAGIKVTDFSGNTVAVDEAGNIVTGEKADKIAAEKNLGESIRVSITPIPNVTVSADFNEETEKEETQDPSSEDKKEPSAPVVPTKTFAEAYKEWLASEPVGGSANVMESWKKRKPKIEDYADGRAFLAKKEAWEKEMPDYDAYLAKTAYADDYEAWQSRVPKLADYTMLVGNQTAEEKYNEDYAAWQELAPKPEDYIQYTSFEADYNAWLAAAPVPVKGKYATYEDAESAYNEAHTEWEANAPKQSDYFDEEGYNQAVTEWTNKVPQKYDYCAPEGYAAAVARYERENPKPVRSNYFNEESYNSACSAHSAKEPQLTDYFLQEDYTAAQNAYTEYCENLAAYEAYVTAKTEYDAAKSQWETDKAAYDNYIAEVERIKEANAQLKAEYDAALAKYNDYLDWEDDTAQEYLGEGIIISCTDSQGCTYYRYENKYTDLGKGNESTDLGVIFEFARADIGYGKFGNDTPENPTEPSYVQLPEEVKDPGEFTQVEPTEVSKPDEKKDPEKNQINYLTDLAKEGNAKDKASAESLFNTAHSQWEQNSPSEDDDYFYNITGYNEALAYWEANYPKESGYYNNEKYDSLDAAKAAYEKAVADHEAAKPSEQDFVKESAGDATDKETALKAFEEDTASYTEESPEPTKEEYTSNVITEEEKAAFEQAVEDYNDAKPIETDSKYVEEAMATEEYKDTVAKHEADKPDQSTYVDDMYDTETAAKYAYKEDHRDWEGEKPSEYDYIINTTYADDLEAWKNSEPDFNEYFGIEAQE